MIKKKYFVSYVCKKGDDRLTYGNVEIFYNFLDKFNHIDVEKHMNVNSTEFNHYVVLNWKFIGFEFN
jgi:hypothetical protein